MLETNNFQASLWMVGSMALFAVEDLFLKWAAEAMPAGQIIAIFGMVGVVMWGAMAWHAGAPLLDRSFFHPMVALRNLTEALGSMGYVAALAFVPLATVGAILQSAPLMVTMGAALFLGERVGWRRWTAIGLGMVGVLMILRPGAAGLSVAALVVVASVVALSVRDLVTRRIPAQIHTLQLTSWAYLGMIPAGFGLLWMQDQSFQPIDRPDGIILAAAYVLGASGYYAVTHAMRIGEAAVVAPYRYTRMVFVLALAILFLKERPDLWVLGGAALIILTGLYALARTRNVAATVQPSPVPGDGI
jgi:drug/metabolite transporter (DMT)-like permease